MPFALRRRLGIDADMHLKRPDLEPRAAPLAQLFRLRNFRKSEHLAIKGKALGLQRLRDGDLHVIDSDDTQRHTRSPRRYLRLPARLQGC